MEYNTVLGKAQMKLLFCLVEKKREHETASSDQVTVLVYAIDLPYSCLMPGVHDGIQFFLRHAFDIAIVATNYNKYVSPILFITIQSVQSSINMQ